MPEAIKNCFNKTFIQSLTAGIQSHYPEFNAKKFNKAVFNKDWEQKELKQRMRHISISLREHLPDNYKKAIGILKKTSRKTGGFEAMVFPDFVEAYGLDHYDESIKALEFFTRHASSEFAIRPFIIKYKTRTMKQMHQWVSSSNHHVRRLASEGCRPRLPWAMALPEFKQNPKPVIKILTRLRNDNSEYVRRSVANSLNDISKDHPELILQIARQWLGRNNETNRLVKHACRTLLKKGHPEILSLFGYEKPDHITINQLENTHKLPIGDDLLFSFSINSKKKLLGKLRIEYAIDFTLANNKLSRKVFKITEGDYKITCKNINKKHSFRLITTRKYYPGRHRLTIIINGKTFCQGQFTLESQVN
ncbi:MAG: DNA alkylation repair protein [Gammaproteobacteria bacterium]|nr:DNA alkylation repair protein [Gammaproteobacteria bacterium]